MIEVEGYRAFYGTMRITPKCSVPPFELTGDWLYKPSCDCWYGRGRSFGADICEIVSESTDDGKIEPVLCGNCKNWEQDLDGSTLNMCSLIHKFTCYDDYCRWGERMEG